MYDKLLPDVFQTMGKLLPMSSKSIKISDKLLSILFKWK
jgi:hypothetical protein